MADFMQVPLFLSGSVKCPLVLLFVSLAISSVQTYNSDNNVFIGQLQTLYPLQDPPGFKTQQPVWKNQPVIGVLSKSFRLAILVNSTNIFKFYALVKTKHILQLFTVRYFPETDLRFEPFLKKFVN